MDTAKIKHALEQAAWSEVRRYLIDKLLELKGKVPAEDLSSKEYKVVGLSIGMAYRKLHEILSELIDFSKEEIGKTEKEREKDSFTSIPK